MEARRVRKSRARTSCLECQRRKQKCNQKQPCSYCLRRFPIVECIYDATADRSEVVAVTRSPRSTVQGTDSPNSHLDFSKNQGGKDINLSVDNLHSFAGDQSYQHLLTLMVSQISEDGISGRIDAGASFIKEAKVHQSQVSKSFYTGSQSDKEAPSSAKSAYFTRYGGEVGTPSRFSISRVDPLHFLGITPTNQSGELLQAFIKLISKYVFSIDGNPSPNYYNDQWVQWSMKSPLLAHLGIFTAACYQAETQKIPPGQSPLALSFKLKSISILNGMLRSNDLSTSNEAIAGVVYLIINEWYWSCYENVQAHMSGLQEMVRLRGGLGEMGMHDFLRKMIILCDYYISCSYGCELSFPHNISFIAIQPIHINTPLQCSGIQFGSIAEDLKIGKEVATILDDMRFIILSVTKQVYRDPTSVEKMKLAKTSVWIRDRIASMPDACFPLHPLANDHLYKSCRVSALIYCRAIVERIPLSQACTLQDLHQLWINMWRITLTRWKEIPGIFLFVILSVNQAAQNTPYGRFLKSMLKASSSYMALDNWALVDGAFATYLKLQRWLGDGKVEVASDPGALEFMHIYRQK